jgi:hypothetical protein
VGFKLLVGWIAGGLAATLGAVVLAAAVAVVYALLRPHRAFAPGPPMGLESWPAVSDGRHNSNTDLFFWRGSYWLVHASGPWHFASARTRLVLRRSSDARSWTEVASFSVPGEDVRDPKLVAFGGRLWLYFFPNRQFPEPQPYTTLVTSSSDGVGWETPAPVEPGGWLLWKPKPLGAELAATAYWHEHDRVALLRSGDGRTWTIVSDIVRGPSADETALEVLEDGRILATSRLEGRDHDSWFGDPEGTTLLSVAAPPYLEWRRTRDDGARLDGPSLFRWRGRVYAVGRFEPDRRHGLFETGSILARKRTALYLVEPHRLAPLGILPSAGDTSYAGVVLRKGDLLISYYTSRVDRDYPWILGMLLPSEIRIARLPLSRLEALAESSP